MIMPGCQMAYFRTFASRLWLLFDSNELFIVEPTTPTTALTLKSIVPLKPEHSLPVAHLGNSQFKSKRNLALLSTGVYISTEIIISAGKKYSDISAQKIHAEIVP